ncbi:trypsin-like serine peptidase [Nonomuraea sp. SBT364]|uniref:trypsin-like serine peptidase n=1 Tax=Nonomuraea sp. SBT364 TaxID=1580530 RepID=UPI00066A558C|nr:trypsin-like peptidase domain-containing protein [Nonomuraea sp. SBT364]
MSRRRTLLALAVAGTAWTVPPVPPAHAAPEPAPPAEASPVMDPERAVDYWTARKQSKADAAELPEAMVLPDRRPRERPALPGRAGRPLSVPQADRLTPGADANGYGQMRRPYTKAANSRATGRLFFLDADGTRRSCSGAVVNSAAKVLLATAAHCVYGVSKRTGRGRWSSNLAFVPAYDGLGKTSAERAPYGVWGAKRVWKPRAFTGAGRWDWDSIYDLALIEVGRQGDRTLQGTVGAYTPMRNEGGRYTVATLGYPSDEPYDGTRQLWCLGRTRAWPGYARPDRRVAGRIYTANCHLFGGNSGGPWLDRASGLLLGVLTSGAADASRAGYAVANPFGRASYGALVRGADPGGVYDALSVRGSVSGTRVTAVVTIRGLAAAANVPVTFALPHGVSLAPGSRCRASGRRVTCMAAVVRPGVPVKVSFPVRGVAGERASYRVSVPVTRLDPDRRDNAHVFTPSSRR